MNISKLLNQYLNLIYRLLIFLMYLLILDVTLQVFGRYIPFIPRYMWTIEIANYLLIWIVFLGSIIAVKESKHFFVDCFSKNNNIIFQKFLRIIYYFVMFSVTFIFIFSGVKYFQIGCDQESMFLGINLGLIHITVPITGISWLLILWNEIIEDDLFKRKR